jgi:hypothetical protein
VLIFMHDRGSLIFQLRSASYTMFETLCVIYSCFLLRPFLWLHILMLFALLVDGLLLGIVCFLATTFFPGP